MAEWPESNDVRVQAAEVAYELHTLGWKAFQNLCVTITGEVWGQTVQSFFDSRDGGRDGAFRGTWKTKAGESFTGSFTVQCKFTSKANQQLKLTDLNDELRKAKRLAAQGLANNYFLFTNARITGTAEETMCQSFQAIAGIEHFAAYGAERISLFIRESSRLRVLVPHIYGLGDLSQILDQRACDQAREILSALGDDLAKFVITEAYQRSAKALAEHGFVLLLGEPACGKSTIAAALAVGALDERGCSTFKIRDADDFITHSNPHEPRQFFWVDDAFGATQFDWMSAANWNRVFPHIQAAIRRGAKVLFTSRDYIYRSARQLLKETALPVIRESQVVIQVEELTKEEREQILYNHIRLGSQPKSVKSELKPFLSKAAAHQRFSPEIARRLGNPLFTKRLYISESGLDAFIAHPVELLCEIIRTLDSGSQSALALVFMRGGMLPSPIGLSGDEERAATLLGGSLSDVRTALNALDGSLLVQSLLGGKYSWHFKHPTVRDAFAAVVAEDRELMDIYLTGTPIEKLFGEVTCGDLKIQGVKVIVPPDRYAALTTRVELFDTARRENKGSVHRFLAYRCNHEFLSSYINRYPHFIAGLRVGSYLTAVSDVDVILRLHEFGLLPEPERMAFVSAMREIAVETPDADFLRERISKLLTSDELAAVLEDVRTKLIPNLGDTISAWRSNFRSDDDPESHFDDLVSVLKRYQEEFADSAEIVTQITSALAQIDVVIEELRSEQPQEPDSDDYRGHDSPTLESDDSRSVFDDVDQ